MTRRTFLRVLGSAAVVAALPSLPLPIPQDRSISLYGIPEALNDGTIAGGSITYEMMEAAYQAAVVGSERPTVFLTYGSQARQNGLVFDADLEEVA